MTKTEQAMESFERWINKILPCKVGEKLYVINRANQSIIECTACCVEIDNGLRINAVYNSEDGCAHDGYCGECPFNTCCLEEDLFVFTKQHIGKIAFKSLAEAEEALRAFNG